MYYIRLIIICIVEKLKKRAIFMKNFSILFWILFMMIVSFLIDLKINQFVN